GLSGSFVRQLGLGEAFTVATIAEPTRSTALWWDVHRRWCHRSWLRSKHVHQRFRGRVVEKHGCAVAGEGISGLHAGAQVSLILPDALESHRLFDGFGGIGGLGTAVEC